MRHCSFLLVLYTCILLCCISSCIKVVDATETDFLCYYYATFNNGDTGIICYDSDDKYEIIFKGQYDTIYAVTSSNDKFLVGNSIDSTGKPYFFKAIDKAGFASLYNINGDCIIPANREYTHINLLYTNFNFFSVSNNTTHGVCDYYGTETIATDKYQYVAPTNTGWDNIYTFYGEKEQLLSEFQTYYDLYYKADNGYSKSVGIFDKDGTALLQLEDIDNIVPICALGNELIDPQFSLKYNNDSKWHIVGFYATYTGYGNMVSIYNSDGRLIIPTTKYDGPFRIGLGTRCKVEVDHNGNPIWVLDRIVWTESLYTVAVYDNEGHAILEPGRYTTEDYLDIDVDYHSTYLDSHSNTEENGFDWIEVTIENNDYTDIVILDSDGNLLYPRQHLLGRRVVYKNGELQIEFYDWDDDNNVRYNYRYERLKTIDEMQSSNNSYSGGLILPPFIPYSSVPSISNDFGSIGNSSTTSDNRIKCSRCNGSGKIVYDTHPPVFGNDYLE